MKNIILIGMMGSGKSTVGRLVADRLKLTLVDTDRMIENQSGAAVRDIFASQGEGYFRAQEAGVAAALSLRSDLVVACGGGLPLQAQAMGALRDSGTVFWLDRDPGDIFDHVNMDYRPLGQGTRAEFVQKAEERRDVYRACADYVITDFTSPISTAARIVEVFK